VQQCIAQQVRRFGGLFIVGIERNELAELILGEAIIAPGRL
jgi:hypothetical protein